MQTWEDLVKTALLGTERGAPTTSKTDALFGDLLTQFAPDDKERALLGASGLCALARRAGVTLSDAPGDAPPPAAPDTAPLFTAAATQDLSRLLEGEWNDMLPEWLELAAPKKRRVPEQILPALLAAGKPHKRIRGNLVGVIGERGKWLAGQNPEWKYALRPSDDEIEEAVSGENLGLSVWETGNREARAAYLRARRRTDPDAARTLLEASWAKEPYEERAAFLETLQAQISASDEPFVEAALDDKRKEVREMAQGILRYLPDSRLSQRMQERARPILSIVPADKHEKLEVTLPDAWEKSWGRDGIDQKPPTYPKIGEKAFWMQGIMRATPLSFWTEHLNRTPEQLVALANANLDWGAALVENWGVALMHEAGLSPWAEPILRYYLNSQNYNLPFSAVWPKILSSERIEQIVLEKLDAAFFRNYGGILGTLATELKPTWSANLADRFLILLQQEAAKQSAEATNTNYAYYYSYAVQRYADFFPIGKLPQLYEAWEKVVTPETYYAQQRTQHMDRTAFQAQMRRHLSEN